MVILDLDNAHDQEGLEGNPAALTIKKFSRVFAVLAVPLTSTFPKALFCYWISSNIFSMLYGQAIKHPSVKKLVGLPEIDLQPPTATQPAASVGSKPLFGESSADSQTPMDQQKLTDTGIHSSSSSISEQIHNLERTLCAVQEEISDRVLAVALADYEIVISRVQNVWLIKARAEDETGLVVVTGSLRIVASVLNSIASCCGIGLRELLRLM
ncbi:hypothetical protein ACLOJK_009966 [Asimina triloba]